jgi:hypothetical protein
MAADLFTPPTAPTVTLDEKLRRAYFWLINKAVISPFYDVEFGSDTTVSYPLGDAGAALSLPKQPAYSSNVLVPLLTFAVGGRCLLIGGRDFDDLVALKYLYQRYSNYLHWLENGR